MHVERFVIGSLLIGLASCGGPKEAAAPSPDPAADAAVESAPKEAELAEEADAGRPFAGSAAEATELITAAVEKKTNGVEKCVREYRFRTHLAHAKVSINIGIDQEGRLIGVTLPKGKQDKELAACVQDELRDAPFPRSHAGVITITRTYEEMVR